MWKKKERKRFSEAHYSSARYVTLPTVALGRAGSCPRPRRGSLARISGTRFSATQCRPATLHAVRGDVPPLLGGAPHISSIAPESARGKGNHEGQGNVPAKGIFAAPPALADFDDALSR